MRNTMAVARSLILQLTSFWKSAWGNFLGKTLGVPSVVYSVLVQILFSHQTKLPSEGKKRIELNHPFSGALPSTSRAHSLLFCVQTLT